MAKIVVDCIDKRMPEALPAILKKIGENGKAYHDSSLGCSLGLDHEYAHIRESIETAGRHGVSIDEIFVFDHMSCLRFKDKYGELTPERERELHIEMLRQRGKELREKFPELKEIHLCLLTDVTDTAIGTDFEEIAEEEGSGASKEVVQVA